MPKILIKKSALFLSSTGVAPTIPAGFIELSEELVLTPSVGSEDYSVVNGLLGAHETIVDTCDNTVTPSINHRMRTSNNAGTVLETPPPYATLLKIGGFTETITGLGATGKVVYKNSQAPVSGSAHFYLDGYKQTATNTVAADLSFDFSVGKVAVISGTLSAFLDNNGVATVQAAPSITPSIEKLLMVACTDIVTAGGVNLKADKVTIKMGAEVGKTYAMGEKGFSVDDYKIMITASFKPENADYNVFINKLNAQTVESIDIRLNTGVAGVLVDGKSVQILVSLAKVTNYNDSADGKKMSREVTWLAQGNATGDIISIIHGDHV